MTQFFKREHLLVNGEFVDDELVPMRPDAEPWEYMFDGPIPERPKPTFKELEKQKAADYKHSREIKEMLEDHYKKCWAYLKGKHNEG